MATNQQAETTTCGCCGGDMPAYEIWEANRDRAGDCTGSIDGQGRCRAWSHEDLWQIESVED